MFCISLERSEQFSSLVLVVGIFSFHVVIIWFWLYVTFLLLDTFNTFYIFSLYFKMCRKVPRFYWFIKALGSWSFSAFYFKHQCNFTFRLCTPSFWFLTLTFCSQPALMTVLWRWLSLLLCQELIEGHGHLSFYQNRLTIHKELFAVQGKTSASMNIGNDQLLRVYSTRWSHQNPKKAKI